MKSTALARSSVKIRPNRQRKEFNEQGISDLAESIRRNGLFTPIVVTQEGDDVYLVAGERRLRALEFLSLTEEEYRHGDFRLSIDKVPCIYFNDLDELAREEIELDENIAREDLTWQERVTAISRRDALRKKQSTSHSTADTAKEIFGLAEAEPAATATVQRSIVLANALGDEDVAKAKSEREAYKILQRKEERKRFEILGREEAAKGTPPSQRHRSYFGDCLDWMVVQLPEQFDIILTDPPYGMSAEEFGDAAGRLQGIDHNYEDSYDATKKLLSRALPEFYRLAKPDAFLFLWCDIDLFPWIRTEAQLAGWRTHRTPFVNIKREGGRVPWPTQGPRRCYELCLYAVKGSRATREIVRDVFESTLTEGNFGHGAQKPVESYEYLLRMVATPLDTVFDPFAGTGTVAVAAHSVGIKSVAVEKDAAAFGIMASRVEELK